MVWRENRCYKMLESREPFIQAVVNVGRQRIGACAAEADGIAVIVYSKADVMFQPSGEPGGAFLQKGRHWEHGGCALIICLPELAVIARPEQDGSGFEGGGLAEYAAASRDIDDVQCFIRAEHGKAGACGAG